MCLSAKGYSSSIAAGGNNTCVLSPVRVAMVICTLTGARDNAAQGGFSPCDSH